MSFGRSEFFWLICQKIYDLVTRAQLELCDLPYVTCVSIWLDNL